ncbi:MAG: pseudouridine-5'-phosphate glycosidase, partial [Actinomycetota bacterium]|nr:pseudouridine-5'-phosphate glycosidase [Actinomycetota bacterium]
LDDAELETLGTGHDVVKLAARDLPAAVVRRAQGATTISATAVLASRAGISVLATGGLGGVHHAARVTRDESADLITLSTTAIVVVCSGVKSILDVGATLERLESLNVSVVGYRTRRFPGFYLADSGYDLDWWVDDPEEVVEILQARRTLGVDRHGLVVANPVPPDAQLDPELHDRALRKGLDEVERRGLAGKPVTPFLLDWLARASGGASVTVNATILRRNAQLAARIARALSSRGAPPHSPTGSAR